MTRSRATRSAAVLIGFITALVPFDRSSAGFTIGVIQEPEWGEGYLAQASCWNWNSYANEYSNGWTMARYSLYQTPIVNARLMYSNWGTVLEDTVNTAYALAENYWGSYYGRAHSCVLGMGGQGDAECDID